MLRFLPTVSHDDGLGVVPVQAPSTPGLRASRLNIECYSAEARHGRTVPHAFVFPALPSLSWYLPASAVFPPQMVQGCAEQCSEMVFLKFINRAYLSRTYVRIRLKALRGRVECI
jgi:hypothetical protein